MFQFGGQFLMHVRQGRFGRIEPIGLGLCGVLDDRHQIIQWGEAVLLGHLGGSLLQDRVPLIQKCIDELEGDGVMLTLVLCTRRFPAFTSP